MQLVDDRVRLYDPMLDRHTGPREVKERLGIEPGQMRDYLALVGDPIDNVPKVPGHRPEDRGRAHPAVRRRGDAARAGWTR